MVQNSAFKLKKKIKIAVIGGGHDSTISKTHLRSILASNKFEITCGCFTKKKKKKKIKTRNFIYCLKKKFIMI